MTLPKFCYEKAFIILFGIIITLGTALFSIAWGMIVDNAEKVQQNEKELEKRSEPISLIPKLYENQIIMCTYLGAPCK